MTWKSPLLLCLATLVLPVASRPAAATAVSPQQAEDTLVLDLNTSLPFAGTSSSPTGLAAGAGQIYFAATGALGREPYVTDGTPEGTRRIRDLRPGPLGSNPVAYMPLPSGQALFWASPESSARELYVTDGTEVGTASLGLSGASLGTGFGVFVVHGDCVYFYRTLDSSVELWRSDGTPSGTEPIVLPADALPVSGALAVAGGEVYFQVLATSGPSSPEIWKTSGTVASFALSVPSSFVSMVALGDELYIGSGTSFFKSDGTEAGTVELSTGDGAPSNLRVVGSLCYFVQNTPTGLELWRSDGSEAGTFVLAPLGKSIGGGNLILGALGERLLFRGFTPAIGREPMVTSADGTSFALIRDIYPGPETSLPLAGRPLGDRFVFVAKDGVSGFEPWVTDLTEAGTFQLADLAPGAADSVNSAWLAELGGRVYFGATGPNGNELYATDGTAAGTELAANIAQDAETADANIREMTALGDRLFFVADAPEERLYVSTGTAEATVPIETVRFVEDIATFNERVFFSAQAQVAGVTNDSFGNEPWISDGTPAGTFRLLDLNPGTPSSNPSGAAQWKDKLYFAAAENSVGRELFVTDGTAAGTELVLDLFPGSLSSSPKRLFAHQDRLYFSAFSAPGFVERIFSLSASGEVELAVASEVLANATYFPLGDELYFYAGNELWRMTENPSAPEQITGVFGTTSVGGLPVLVGDSIVFAGPSSSGLFRTQGTTASVELVNPVGPIVNGSLVAAGSVAYFEEFTGAAANVLWVTDATSAGTQSLGSIADRVLAPIGSGESALVSGYDVERGFETWISDGTPGGTTLLFDVNPGESGSLPESAVRVGAGVFFVADDGVTGRELHRFGLVDTGGYVQELYGTGCPGSNGLTPSISRTAPPSATQPSAIVLSNAAPNSPTFLFYGFSASLALQDSGCVPYIAPPLFSIPLTTDANGSASLSVSPSPGLLGVKLYQQFATIDIGGGFLDILSLTEGLEVVIGI